MRSWSWRLALAANCLDKVGRVFRSSPDMKTVIPSVLITFALVCFALVQNTQAVIPSPDGGYPGGNTAEGTKALLSQTTGGYNAAIGWLSLESLTTGSFNTGVGAGTLALNNGDQNTATGAAALLLNTTGTGNTANGALALLHNDTGSFNTAAGNLALSNNITGTFNSGFGQGALASNTLGTDDTASGAGALFSNTTGSGNTANGFQALNFNNVGSGNTAVGFQALEHNTTGNYNIAVGFQAGLAVTTGDNNINIGNLGSSGASNEIRIGTQGTQQLTFIAGISDDIQAFGTTVIVTDQGLLGIQASSARFKDEIKSMGTASEGLFALKPVTFHYKKEIDPQGISQFGLVAEEVEKVNPDLVVRDKQRKPYSVRYDQVNAMLLNEFLKEHRKVEKLEATVAALAAQLDKVAAQVQIKQPAMQVTVEKQ